MRFPLLQLGDSALPIGGYSHSWGLEAAVARGLVVDAPTLERWILCWLEHTAGSCEGVIVAAVARAIAQGEWRIACEANEMLLASLAPPTLRIASRDMGEHLLHLADAWPWATEAVDRLRELHDSPLPCTRGRGVGGEGGFTAASPSPLPLSPEYGGEGSRTSGPWQHAVVFATLAAWAGATAGEALRVYLHQAILGMLGAGVRGIPIGHTHGQEILARLHGPLEQLCEQLADRPLETAGANCPAYEVLCYEQSRLYTRIFRS